MAERLVLDPPAHCVEAAVRDTHHMKRVSDSGGVIKVRRQSCAERLRQVLVADAPTGWSARIVPGQSSVGGGTFSATSIESRLLMWAGPKAELERCHQLLRLGDPALVGRMNQDGLAVDMRTIAESEVDLVVRAFQRAWQAMDSNGRSG